MRYIEKREINDCKPLNWDRNASSWTRRVRDSQDKSSEIKKIGNKWSDFKPGFIDKFGDKCWYTESPRIGTDNDVDHFFPKGRVKDINGDIVSSAGGCHSGYWWKAYDPQNYRYSCVFANRSRDDGGKVDYFPLTDEANRAWTESCACDYSHRLLLDPCNKDDVELLSFEIGLGNAASRVSESENSDVYERVKNSIQLLNLNHSSISSERIRAISHARDLLFAIRISHQSDDLDGVELAQLAEIKQRLIDMCGRKSAFSAAVVEAVAPYQNAEYLADIKDQLDLTP